MINIEGLRKADVLRVLYNHAEPKGLGFAHFEPKDMTIEEAEKILKESTYFDYLKGRAMKVFLNSDIEFSERIYDKYNGEGKAQRLIDELRANDGK